MAHYTEQLKREFVERQKNDRRNKANEAIKRHFDIVDRDCPPEFEDRRKSDRRASDRDAVNNWIDRFHGLRSTRAA